MTEPSNWFQDDAGNWRQHAEPRSGKVGPFVVHATDDDPVPDVVVAAMAAAGRGYEPARVLHWSAAGGVDRIGYHGVVAYFNHGSPFDPLLPYAILSVSSDDERARHDWRDLQQIKTGIVGAEWEGLELYPAESNLRDPSNRFYLWCFPKGQVSWSLGGRGRVVRQAKEAKAPQRPFPSE